MKGVLHGINHQVSGDVNAVLQGNSRQVPGDAPVTVSDGSLHAHSESKWDKDTVILGDSTIRPQPIDGKLYANCTITNAAHTPVKAIFWRDEMLDDITPATAAGTNITITYDTPGANGDDPSVIINVPQSTGPLTITTKSGSFNKSHDDAKHNRQHSRGGEVEHITVDGVTLPDGSVGRIEWNPYNPYHPHFTLAFCYKK